MPSYWIDITTSSHHADGYRVEACSEAPEYRHRHNGGPWQPGLPPQPTTPTAATSAARERKETMAADRHLVRTQRIEATGPSGEVAYIENTTGVRDVLAEDTDDLGVTRVVLDGTQWHLRCAWWSLAFASERDARRAQEIFASRYEAGKRDAQTTIKKALGLE